MKKQKTKTIKRPQQPVPPIKRVNSKWARSDKEKVTTFAEHLAIVFKPFPPKEPENSDYEMRLYQDAPYQIDLPIRKFKVLYMK